MFITLKDGSKKEVLEGWNGFDLANSIAPSLAKKAIAYSLNGKVYDLFYKIQEEGELIFLMAGDIDSYELLNHSTSHLLAEAIQHLYPKAKFGFGPAIEEGFYYDIDFGDEVITDASFALIEKEMHKCAEKNSPIVRKEVSKEEALEIFKDNPYKKELIEGIEGTISLYTQDDFTDLCAGMHLPRTGLIRHFKLLSLAGVYWRGDVKNKQLTRIYGTSWFSEEELKTHLNNLEERKKRDHKKLGKELGLFMFSEYGPGLPFWLPQGYTLRRTLEDWWLELHKKNGYVVIESPIMLSKELWETSGHWDYYKENMYITKVDENDFAIKPMNCPGAILVYKNDLHSYRDLPMRIAELGHVHRHEASGALNGLFRVRTFTQDDAHTLLREDQIESEIEHLLKIYDEVYSTFGLNYHIELSTRPFDNFIGEVEVWDRAEAALTRACKATGHPFKINPGDGAFYGPKLDFKLKDSMNRIWQCGTIQLDMQLPSRFDCSYIDENGEKVCPVMIHRAIFGSIERFLAILIENFAGALPTWLFPTQVRILPVAVQAHKEAALALKEKLEQHHIRVDVDLRSEKLGYKLREAQMKKIPYSIVVGDKEAQDGSVTYRLYGKSEQIHASFEEFLNLLLEEIQTKSLRK